MFWKNWFRRWKSTPEDNDPYILFKVKDGDKLEIDMGWIKGTDVRTFAKVLWLINTGQTIGHQATMAMAYAQSIGEPESAMIIHSALQNAANVKREEDQSDGPLVPPSKVILNQMKLHNGN